MPELLEIAYRARGGRMAVDLDLRLGSDAQATLFVGNSYSIPLARVSRVGTFEGRAPAAEVDALRAYLAEHDVLARGGTHGQPSPDTPARYLTIAVDGRTAELGLTGTASDAELDGFERLLHGLALALTSQPTRAVEASLALGSVGGQIAATIELRSIGTRPISVLLVDPSQPGMTLHAQVALDGKVALPGGASVPMPLGGVELAPDAVQALVQDGALPGGIAELSPGAVYRIELPPLAVPQTALPVVATGALVFWQPDGQARRTLTVLTPETPLP
jgi:hypothetical protein